MLFPVLAWGLNLALEPFGVWFVIAAILAALAAVVPRLLTAWLFLLIVGVSVLWIEPNVTDPRAYLALAGIHLLHLLATQLTVLPWRERVEVRALLRPWRAFVTIQVPAQLVLATVLLVSTPRVGWTLPALPLLAVLGAAAALALVVLLVLPLASRQRR
jgi:hypothetical protein